MIQKSNKIALLICIIFIFTYGQVDLSSENKSDKLTNDEIMELKDFAVCRCLIYEFAEDSIHVNEGTSSAIIELGKFGFDHYNFIDSIAKNYVNTVKMNSYDNSKLGILKCLNFYHSEILDSLVKNIRYIIDEDEINK